MFIAAVIFVFPVVYCVITMKIFVSKTVGFYKICGTMETKMGNLL